jgi:hypothetical protein
MPRGRSALPAHGLAVIHGLPVVHAALARSLLASRAMPSPAVRRCVMLALLAPVTLAACIISSTPPNPHKQAADTLTGEPDGDVPDASDAADATEDP